MTTDKITRYFDETGESQYLDAMERGISASENAAVDRAENQYTD